MVAVFAMGNKEESVSPSDGNDTDDPRAVSRMEEDGDGHQPPEVVRHRPSRSGQVAGTAVPFDFEERRRVEQELGGIEHAITSINKQGRAGVDQGDSKREIIAPADKEEKHGEEDEEDDDDDGPGGNSELSAQRRCAYCNQTEVLYWMFISAGAVIGATLRVYLSRIFGADCELEESAVQDIFTPLFSRICITASGKTMQTGGALFRDLPSNLLGSFFMGILTCNQHSSPFPWFHKDHALQQNKYLNAAFGVGLCGSLTTFASWNSQMVVMMDGTYAELGPQVAAALFGYLLGMMVCLSSFRVGRLASSWIYSRTNQMTETSGSNETTQLGTPTSNEDRVSPQDEISTTSCAGRCFRCIYSLHFVAFLIICLFILGGYLNGNNIFYKNMTAVSLMSPLGAVSRWKLSNHWNNSMRPQILKARWPWLPWGTFVANMTGAIVSITCQGLLDRYGEASTSEGMDTLLFAIKTGFAGSLSTVSTLVKEVVTLEEKYPGHAKPFFYSVGTCVGGMTVGLMIYMLIVRI